MVLCSKVQLYILEDLPQTGRNIFFLISNKTNLIESARCLEAHKKYTKGTTLTRNIKKKKKITKTNQQRRHIRHNPKIRSFKKYRNNIPLELSLSSKFLSFISFHKHQNRHVCTIFHIAVLLGLPEDHQQSYKSMTRLSITQDIPKRLKRTLQIAKATFTMKKKVVHKFSIPLAHAKSVHHDDVSPPKIIQSDDIS
jgi:hypothetical protein